MAAIATVSAHAELIPAARLADWTPGVVVGVQGGIPTNRTNFIDVTQPPYNADRTGATNVSPVIQAAIDAAPAGSVVYLPAGTYRLDATLYFMAHKDGITLRGAGPAVTTIRSQAQTGIFVGSSSDYNWTWPNSGNVVSGTRTKGTATLTLGNTDAFNVGQIVQIKVADQLLESALKAGATPVVNTFSYPENRKMKSRIVGKTSTSLTISPALHFDCTGLTTTLNVAQTQTDSVGIEDLTLDCAPGVVQMGVEFEQCFGSWIKNVKVNNAANYAFFLYDSLNCEIRQSFANQRNGAGTNGAGILCNASSACLVEDNIIYKFFPLIEVNHGSSGNVFGYNLFEDSRVYGVLGCAINSNHGPHNSYNLYEGNIAPNVQSDGYFGSASEDTFFRNWLHGTVYDRSVSGFLISLNRFTRNYSLVGNILGTSATQFANPYSFGNPNMGNSSYVGTVQPTSGIVWSDWTRLKTDAAGHGVGPAGFQELDLDVQATTLVKGNHIAKLGQIPIAESLGGDVLPDSLYLPGKPAWFGSLTWPAFNPASPQASYESIPAGYRFVHGSTVAGPTPPPLPVVTAPKITAQPQSVTAAAGTSPTLSVTVSGNPVPSVEWRKDGVTISGATGTTLTIANAQTSHTGVYTAIATNSAGVAVSDQAFLTVTSPSLGAAPVFTVHPVSHTASALSSTTFSVEATGVPTPTYQWRKNGVNFPGATTASLTLVALTTNDNATYTVVATNSVGSTTSTGAVLTVTASTPSMSAPVFTVQPTSRTATALSSITFTAEATGVPAPTYQWRKNGVNFPGATAASLTLVALTTNDDATYTVVATNSAGSVTSSGAVLTVAPATVTAAVPVFTVQPTNRTVTALSSTTFTAQATGTPAPTYRWRKNGVNLPGATGSSLTLVALTTNDNATYTVVAANSAGTATSKGAVLKVSSPRQSSRQNQ